MITTSGIGIFLLRPSMLRDIILRAWDIEKLRKI
jgi:hypothetical protein